MISDHITQDRPVSSLFRKCGPVLKNRDGSVMVIVIIILALLTLAGISATNMSITESYIVRNTGIYKQNVALAEMAALEGVRRLLDENNPALLDPDRLPNDWLNPKSMNQDFNTLVLTDNNSVVPAGVISGDINVIGRRGETAATPLRYYFAGWAPPAKNSLKATGPSWKTGKVVGSYSSGSYGRVRVEIGIKKKF